MVKMEYEGIAQRVQRFMRDPSATPAGKVQGKGMQNKSQRSKIGMNKRKISAELLKL
jgi:hypothetical protein